MNVTLDKIYDLKSFDQAKNYFETSDSLGGVVLAKNLEHVSSEVFKQRIAGLSFLTGTSIMVNNEGGVAKSIRKIKTSINGDFAESGTMTDTTGKISIGAEDDTMSVYHKEAFSSWSELELQQAQLENRNLATEFISAHDTKYKENIDRLGYLGNGTKTTGLLNYAGFASTSASNTFANLSAQEMYDEIKDLINSQRAGVLNDEVFSCNKLAMHGDTYNLLNSTPLNTASGLTTVLEAITRLLNVSVVITPKAKISSVYRVVAYSSDRQAMQMRIPMPLKIYNQFVKGSRSEFESMFGVAGLDIIESLSGSILTGV